MGVTQLIEVDLRNPVFREEVVSLAFRMGVIDDKKPYQVGDLGQLVANILSSPNARHHITNLFLGKSYEKEAKWALLRYTDISEAFVHTLNALDKAAYWTGNPESVKRIAEIYSQDLFRQVAIKYKGDELDAVMLNLSKIDFWTNSGAAVTIAAQVANMYEGNLLKIAMKFMGDIAYLKKNPRDVVIATEVLADDNFREVVTRLGENFMERALYHLWRSMERGEYDRMPPMNVPAHYLKTTTLPQLVF